jgi:hypothetical protein
MVLRYALCETENRLLDLERKELILDLFSVLFKTVEGMERSVVMVIGVTSACRLVAPDADKL